jgi:uncharacterized repeat protein (TIGR03843 family)
VELTPEHTGELTRLLGRGDLEVIGRLPSSNATFLASVCAGGDAFAVVYKPRRGERPLWDFPDGTLCLREAAAARLSALLGWAVVPPTVLREGPLGPGMVQAFVDHDPDEHYFTLCETHAEAMVRIAAFDVVANNADRKAGHCLRARHDDHIWGIDHGLTFHVVPKLRTVIWDFAGDPLPGELAEALRAVRPGLRADPVLTQLLRPAELQALEARIDRLLAAGHLPDPDPGTHAVPWPLV